LNEPYVGDAVILDAALSERAGHWFLAERAYGLWYLPGRSSYRDGAGLDLYTRWTRWSLANPFVSLYGEYRVGTELRGRGFPDAHRLRALLGVALPSAWGDIMAYGFGDVGNRYGIRGLTNEATLGIAVRFALGTPPAP